MPGVVVPRASTLIRYGQTRRGVDDMTTVNARLLAVLQWIAAFMDEFGKIPSYHREADRWIELSRRVTSGRMDPQTLLRERKTD